jgi:hypothetical protein
MAAGETASGTVSAVGERRWARFAFGLALTAGAHAIIFSIWPIAVLQGWEETAGNWGVIWHTAGAFDLLAAYFVRRQHPVASPILSISGLLLIGTALRSGRLLALAELEFWWLAITFDLLPILLGVLAAGALAARVRPWDSVSEPTAAVLVKRVELG